MDILATVSAWRSNVTGDHMYGWAMRGGIEAAHSGSMAYGAGYCAERGKDKEDAVEQLIETGSQA